MKNTSYKTFTLIEMLIVIVIIGILAAALIPRLQSVQGRARDTKRKTDLKQIHTANELYLLDNGKYASSSNSTSSCAYNSNCYVASTQAQPWISGFSNYMTTLPVDPINNLPNPWNLGQYSYSYGNVYDNQGPGGKNTYDLTTQLENTRDPDRCGVKLYTFWYNNTLWCGTYSTQIYEFSPDSNSF